MAGKAKIVVPSYQKIAVDIAEDITDGRYVVGQKILGRSTLASQYKVSSETIRKAVCILQDIGIVTVTKGSGIVISSVENAVKFIGQYQTVRSVGDIRRDVANWANRQKEEREELLANIEKLLEITERYEEMNPFLPHRLQITETMKNIGKKSSEIMFWQNTGATIIAIKRNKEIILSPGPYAEFHVHDIIYFIGEKESYDRVKKLFTGEPV